MLVESKPLGTGGSILNAIDELELRESFLVANADTWLGAGVEMLSKKAPSSLAAVKSGSTKRYGALKLKNNRVVAFSEKPDMEDVGFINSGLYHLEVNAFDDFEVGSSFSLEEHVLKKMVAAGRLSAYPIDSDFIDIGIPEDYLRFCRWIEAGKKHDL